MEYFLAGKTPPTILTYFYADVGGPEIPTLPSAAAVHAHSQLLERQVAQKTREQIQTQTQEDETPRLTLDLFCDGACVNNGRRGARAAFGLVVYRSGTEIAAAAEPLAAHETQTNQRAELRGLQAALTYGQKAVAAGATTIRIYSDSEYAINCVTRWAPGWARAGWRKADKGPVLHSDLIVPMFEAWKELRGYAFLQHVAAHTGRTDPLSLGNARADELATSALAR
jgi:ribonuclease HI